MSNLIPFQFESNEIRVVTDDNGEPLFVAKDVIQALGYSDGTQPSRATAHIPYEWRGVHPITTPGGTQQMAILTEQGLYFFLARSDKPKALPFQKWLAGEVLPSIRKTGRYEYRTPVAPETNITALKLSRSAMAAARAFGFRGNFAALSADNAIRAITGVSVLALMGHEHLTAEPRGRSYTPTDLGKMLVEPLSAIKLNRMFEEKGMQLHDIKGDWMPTDKGGPHCELVDTNKRHSNGTPVKQLRWFASVLDALDLQYHNLDEVVTASSPSTTTA